MVELARGEMLRGDRRQIRVLHIAPDLAQGGAERMLWQLARQTHSEIGHSLVLMQDTVFFDRSGLEISALGFDFARPVLSAARILPALQAINSIIEEERPDIVQGWLYYGAFLASMATRRVPLVWSIHNTTLPPVRQKPLLRAVNRLLATASARLPTRVIYCAEAARVVHEQHGYARDKSVVIENGVDTSRFRSDASQRQPIRSSLTLGDDTLAIGLFCRWNPQKNIPGCLDAFALARAERPDMVLILAGREMEVTNRHLVGMIQQRGLSGACRLVGPVQGMEAMMNAVDVVMMGSGYGEAMPMVLLEALASRIPIAATRIGDVARLKVPRQAIAAVGDVQGLAEAILFASRSGSNNDWEAAFDQAGRHYTIERCAAAHAELYAALVNERAGGRGVS